MTGYKIQYGEYGHDCWGAREFSGWHDYDRVVYIDKDKALKEMYNAREQFPDRDWDIYEVEVV